MYFKTLLTHDGQLSRAVFYNDSGQYQYAVARASKKLYYLSRYSSFTSGQVVCSKQIPPEYVERSGGTITGGTCFNIFIPYNAIMYEDAPVKLNACVTRMTPVADDPGYISLDDAEVFYTDLTDFVATDLLPPGISPSGALRISFGCHDFNNVGNTIVGAEYKLFVAGDRYYTVTVTSDFYLKIRCYNDWPTAVQEFPDGIYYSLSNPVVIDVLDTDKDVQLYSSSAQAMSIATSAMNVADQTAQVVNNSNISNLISI